MYPHKIANLAISILLALFFTACSMNNLMTPNKKKTYEKKEITTSLINEVINITHLIKQNNLALLNSKYINSKYGLYEVSKFDGKNIFEHKNNITAIKNEVDSFEVKNEKANFYCSTTDDSLYGWDKEGIYLNAKTRPLITTIMEEANILKPNSYKEEEIEKVDFIEQTSYEVTITYNMIFYLTLIDDKWYITLIDNATTNCLD
jgi:hypothetical protein